MSVYQWSKSEAKYVRKLLASGCEGARWGRKKFLNGKSLSPLLSRSVQVAIRPAVLGAFVGLLGSFPGDRHTLSVRAFAFSLLGGAIGFSAGMAWKNRGVTGSAVSEALSSMGKVRDEHWLDRHPIDYA
jgi:hypothetical protein